jgi:chaperonin GroEL (HSP60 family)
LRTLARGMRTSALLCTYSRSISRLVQDVASKTNEVAGDGTTTATVLARAIYSEGVKNVAAGCSPMDLRRGSQKAVEKVIEVLEKERKLIATSEEIAQVYSIQHCINHSRLTSSAGSDHIG